jgi:hypothetical protein
MLFFFVIYFYRKNYLFSLSVKGVPISYLNTESKSNKIAFTKRWSPT